MKTNQNRDTIIEYRDTTDRYKDISMEEIIKKIEQELSLIHISEPTRRS